MKAPSGSSPSPSRYLGALPKSFRIDLDRAVVIVRGEGTLGPRDIVDLVEAFASRPDYRPEMNILWDFREARFFIELKEMKALAEHFSTLGTRDVPHRLAFVLEHESSQLLARLFPKLGPEHVVDYRTFDDLAEALEWLGLPPDCEP